MTKFLKLRFENAKYFKHDSKTKDKYLDSGILCNRSDFTMFKNPITIYQIANVMRVLSGERPIPSLRDTGYKYLFENDTYMQYAQQSYIKFDYDSEYSDFMHTNKPFSNSWNTVGVIYWEKIKIILNDKFDNFIEVLNKETQTNVLDKPFMELRNLTYNTNNKNIIDIINNIKKASIKNFLLNDTYTLSQFNMDSNIHRMNLNGINKGVCCISGYIMVEVPYDYEYVNNVCNILDNGIVIIEDVVDDFENDGYNLISEISTEKI